MMKMVYIIAYIFSNSILLVAMYEIKCPDDLKINILLKVYLDRV